MNTDYVDERDYRLALLGEGKLAETWKKRPAKLVYNLCNEIARLRNAVDFWRQEFEFLYSRSRDLLVVDNEWGVTCLNCMYCWPINKPEAEFHHIDCHANPMG